MLAQLGTIDAIWCYVVEIMMSLQINLSSAKLAVMVNVLVDKDFVTVTFVTEVTEEVLQREYLGG